MKIIECPINGPRPLQEFHYGGEVRPMPDPAAVTDQQWADYVFHRSGEPGVKRKVFVFVVLRESKQLQHQPVALAEAVLTRMSFVAAGAGTLRRHGHPPRINAGAASAGMMAPRV